MSEPNLMEPTTSSSVGETANNGRQKDKVSVDFTNSIRGTLQYMFSELYPSENDLYDDDDEPAGSVKVESVPSNSIPDDKVAIQQEGINVHQVEDMGIAGESNNDIVDSSKQQDDMLHQAHEQSTVLEGELVRAVQIAQEKDQKDLDQMREYGLLYSHDIPMPQSNLIIDSDWIERNNLLNARKMMELHELEILDRTLPRIPFHSHTTTFHDSNNNRKDASTTNSMTIKDETNVSMTQKLITRVKSELERDNERRKPLKLPPQRMNMHDVKYNQTILNRMKRKNEYLHNPRHSNQSSSSASNLPISNDYQYLTPAQASKQNILICNPEKIHYTDYIGNTEYESTMVITNPSKHLIRYTILPPSTRYFTISNIRTPQCDSGLIAAGMSCSVTIRFLPDSSRDYYDSILLCNELGRVCIPIHAYRQPPHLSLPNIMHCGWSLIDNPTTIIFKCLNTGGTSLFHFTKPRYDSSEIDADTKWIPIHDKDEDGECEYKLIDWTQLEQQQDDGDDKNCIECGRVTISPATFRLNKDESIDIHVTYCSKSLGEIVEYIELMCVNGLRRMYKIVANICKPNITLQRIDDTAIVNHHVHALVFDDTFVNGVSTKSLTLTNQTHVPLRYLWSIIGMHDDPMTPSPSPFTISSVHGLFQAHESYTFTITYSPRNIAWHRARLQVNWSGDDDRSVSYMEYTVIGQCIACNVVLSPTILHITNTLTPHHQSLNHYVTLTNHSNAHVHYEWMNNDTKSIEYDIQPSRGLLNGNESTRIFIGITCTTMMMIDTLLQCHIRYSDDDDHIQYLRIRATCDGPRIMFKSGSRIEFGLLNYGESRDRVMKRCLLEFVNQSKDVAVKYEFSEKSKTNDQQQQLSFTPNRGIVPPNGLGQTIVTFTPNSCQNYDSMIECRIENGDIQRIQAIGRVQSPRVILLNNEYTNNHHHVYVRVPLQIHVGVRNLTHLPATYEWEEQLNQDFKITFDHETSKGKLNAKQTIFTTMYLTAFQAKFIDTIVIVYVDGLLYPLGFRIRVNITDIRLSIHQLFKRPSNDLRRAIRISTAMNNGQCVVDSNSLFDIQHELDEEFPPPSSSFTNQTNTKTTIEFGKCTKIYDQLQTRLIIRNHSAVPSRFTIGMGNLGLQFIDDRVLDIIRELTHSNPIGGGDDQIINNAQRDNNNESKLLCRSHEHLRFQSENGQTYVQQGIRRNTIRQILSGKGCAFVVYPMNGYIGAWSVIEIGVFCFNDMCGTYMDEFTINIDGLQTPYNVTMNINVTGSPLSYATHSSGMHKHDDDALLTFKPLSIGAGVHVKRVRIDNQGSFDVKLHVAMTVDDEHSDDCVIVDTRIVNNDDDVQVKIRPYRHQSVDNTFALQVDPQWIVVRANSHNHIDITYNPTNVPCTTRAIVKSDVFMRPVDCKRIVGDDDDDEWIRKLTLIDDDFKQMFIDCGNEWTIAPRIMRNNALQLHVVASSIQPKVTFHESSHDDDDDDDSSKRILFHIKSNEIVKSTPKVHGNTTMSRNTFIRFIPLTNCTRAMLTFTITIQPSQYFALESVKTSTKIWRPTTSSSSSSSIQLMPCEHASIGIRFTPPSPKRVDEWRMVPIHHVHGRMIVHHVNGDEQCLELTSILLRPIIEIRPNSHEFGRIHMDRCANCILYLYNLSDIEHASWNVVHIKKSIAKVAPLTDPSVLQHLCSATYDLDYDSIDDPTVFQFSHTNGTCSARTLPRQTSKPPCNDAAAYDKKRQPFELKIRFKPKANRNYKCRYILRVDDGQDVEFHLSGSGSNHEEDDVESVSSFNCC